MTMIRKLVRQMLTAQIFSALTVSVCLLLDNLMIGRFLGVRAMAAYGFANPILLAIGAVGSLMTAGVQVVCSRSLGKGSQEETNRGYSSALALTGGISLLFFLVVLLFRDPLATLLGAVESPELHKETSDYMLGFTIGAPGSIGALVLVPFLQMAGKTGLLIAAVGTMAVADVAFDLLSVQVFHAGMFGIGLASSLSYYAAMAVTAFYFLNRKKCVFRFSWKGVSGKKMLELIKGGAPTMVGMACTILLVFIMNMILRNRDGSEAVAAFTLAMSLGNASNCISTGMGGVSLTLHGILYNEEDRTGLKQLLGILCRYAVIIGLAVGVLLLVAAPWLVRLFIDPSESQRTVEMAILALRLFGAGLAPCCLLNALRGAYQATDRVRVMEIISVLEGLIMPVICALIFSALWGVTGAWLYFPGGELLTLVLVCLFVWRKSRSSALNPEAFLMFRSSFGVSGRDLLETEIRSREDVMNTVHQVTDFCREHALDGRMTNRIALCVEEMASNVITHGFGKGGEECHLSLRLQVKEGRWVLRFRDDCRAFDPVKYVPREDTGSGVGIRIVLGMAKEVRYTYSMNMNNLTILF
ncbi:MAG: ATP-binding protein [Clostridia bacterium]|nr:ATP-binding protein [Clostridia bacterium]